MKFSNSIQVVDSHTVGQATRVIVGGIPVLKGKTMMERKMIWLKTMIIYVLQQC